MAKPKLSIPVERRRVTLKSNIMQSKVKIAEHRERIKQHREELAAMAPKKPPVE